MINKFIKEEEELAKLLESFEELRIIKEVIKVFRLYHDINFHRLEKAFEKLHPVLILHDVGGSLMHRVSEEPLQIDR